MTPEIPDLDLERLFVLMDEIEQGRQPAIDRLLKQRADIEEKLKRLGYPNGSPPVEVPEAVHTAPAEPAAIPRVVIPGAANGTTKTMVRHCRNCGKPGHDIRSCPKLY